MDYVHLCAKEYKMFEDNFENIISELITHNVLFEKKFDEITKFLKIGKITFVVVGGLAAVHLAGSIWRGYSLSEKVAEPVKQYTKDCVCQDCGKQSKCSVINNKVIAMWCILCGYVMDYATSKRLVIRKEGFEDKCLHKPLKNNAVVFGPCINIGVYEPQKDNVVVYGPFADMDGTEHYRLYKTCNTCYNFDMYENIQLSKYHPQKMYIRLNPDNSEMIPPLNLN